VQRFNFTPVQALKHAGVDFFQAVVELDLQTQPFGDRLRGFHRSPQRAAKDCFERL
jgi:hypothetical protein